MLRKRAIALCVAIVGLGCWCDRVPAQCVDGSCGGSAGVLYGSGGGTAGGGMGGGAMMGGDTYAFAAGGPQQRAYGRTWGNGYGKGDWDRFYHYPYVYYPQNFWGNEYYKSADSLYYRYPAEMRIPVYNRKWHNYYPNCRPYHQGHHFILDVF